MAEGEKAEVSHEASRAIATAVREEIARRRITRQRLADEARISLSTLEKALSGRRPFTLATIVRIEEALKVRLRPGNGSAAGPANSHASAGLAPDDLGNYSRPAVQWLEGDYLTLRPSFGDPASIYAYRTEIRWSTESSSLMFRESDRIDADFTQHGHVSVPHQSGYIYLVTNRHGQYRLIIVSRPTISGEMYGILTTLQAGRGSQLLPVATPIALVPLEKARTPRFGRIAPTDRDHGRYRTYIRRTVEEQFAKFLTS
ncbi:MAG: helix-turn-helix transcriptional regulator [Hyphomicrobiaceae bacterium]